MRSKHSDFGAPSRRSYSLCVVVCFFPWIAPLIRAVALAPGTIVRSLEGLFRSIRSKMVTRKTTEAGAGALEVVIEDPRFDLISMRLRVF
jgi:hypothetical protein